MRVAPHCLSTSIAAVAEPPVASIGSRMQAEVHGRLVGQLVVVLDRPQRPLVAEEAQVPDLRGRHQLEHRVDHAETRPQDGNVADAVRQPSALDLLQRCRHLH